MKATALEFSPFGVNTYILWNAAGGDAIVVDPGMMSQRECKKMKYTLEKNELTVRHILQTHCHVDHISGSSWLSKLTGAPVAAHRLEKEIVELVPQQVLRYGLRVPNLDFEDLKVDYTLEPGLRLELDGEPLIVLHTPGHSRGSISLYAPESSLVLTGDTLFWHSVGRTDLLGGSMTEQLNSISTQLLTLPKETLVAPGHGPTTTIGEEDLHNPYLH